MSSSHCQDSLCTNGNCKGCKDGKLWCDDPRCFPYCRACELIKNHEETSNWALTTILVLFIILFAILLIGYGPRFVEYRSDGEKVQHSNTGIWMNDNIKV